VKLFLTILCLQSQVYAPPPCDFSIQRLPGIGRCIRTDQITSSR
jgi:hypothetical protein